MNNAENIKDKLENMANQTSDSTFVDLENTKVLDLIKAEVLNGDLLTEVRNIENISRAEIKMLVDLFYQQQDYRKALREQIRSIENENVTGNDTNIAILDWCLKNVTILEKGIQDCLQAICESTEVGRWLLSIKGIGCVLAAGILAYLDVTRVQYATQFISYAGLNDNNRPWLGEAKSRKIVDEVMDGKKKIDDDMVVMIAAKTQWSYNYLLENAYDDQKGKWSKDKLIKACAKIPYNKKLKVHMHKVGESFHWLMNNKESFYGKIFNERKVYETRLNEEGAYAEQAAKILEEKTFSKSTEAYKAYSQGKLPKAHINARALRYVQKIFISHVFEEMYRAEYDCIPPRYYTLEHMEGHYDEILPEVPYTKVSEEM